MKRQRQVIDISRRQMLRGIGGATLALPVLPSLLCKTAYAADPVFTRPPRLWWVTTEHGGAFEASMFPSTSLLTNSQALYSDHTVKSGTLAPTTSGSDTVVSPVLRAPSSALSAALVAKMNVLWGLDVPFYIAHNTGLHLGQLRAQRRQRRRRQGGAGVPASHHRSDHGVVAVVLFEPVQHPRAGDDHVEPARVVELHRPVDDQQHHRQRARLLELAGSVQQDLRPDHGRRAGAARADRRPRAGQLQPPAQRQHAPVGGRQAAPGRSRRAHRRAAAQADHDGQRRVLFQRHDADRQRQQAQRATRPADAGKQLQLWNEVAAAAFMCGTSRIGVLAYGDTSRFVAYGGDWHQEVAHQWQLADKQALLVQSYQQLLRVGHGRHGEAPRQRRGGAGPDLPRPLAAGVDAGDAAWRRTARCRCRS